MRTCAAEEEIAVARDAEIVDAESNGAMEAVESVCNADERNFLRFNLWAKGRAKGKTSRKTIKPRAGAPQ